MGLNETPSGERVTIAFFGVRNAGKSSVVNAVTGQRLAVVSDVRGTTTDPVKKAMELLPLGPVVIVDTPGIDDEGELGEMRVAQARRVLRGCDVAVLVVDGTRALTSADEGLLAEFKARSVPFVVAWNKADEARRPIPAQLVERTQAVSAATGEGIRELKERIAHIADKPAASRRSSRSCATSSTTPACRSSAARRSLPPPSTPCASRPRSW